MKTIRKALYPLFLVAVALDRRFANEWMSNLSRKIYKLSLRKRFRHRKVTSPRFAIERRRDDAGAYNIRWDGQLIAKTASLNGMRGSQSGSCFIIATGPSINDLDLSRLKGKKIMGVNGCLEKLKQSAIKPDYYTITDRDFFQHRFQMVKDVISMQTTCFFSAEGLSTICEKDPRILQDEFCLVQLINCDYTQERLSLKESLPHLRTDPDFYLSETQYAGSKLIGWSRDIEKGHFGGRTVVFGALQTLRYIGFDKIFIIGMDLNYQEKMPRFYETRENMRPSRIEKYYKNFILPSFEIAKAVAIEDDFRIYNISSSSRLPEDVIPKIDFEEALKIANE